MVSKLKILFDALLSVLTMYIQSHCLSLRKSIFYSQKYREMCQKAKMETEHLSGLLREKEIELNACQKEIEMNMTQIKHLEQRISEVSLTQYYFLFLKYFPSVGDLISFLLQLHERSKNIDVEDYDRIKEDFQQMQVIQIGLNPDLHGWLNLLGDSYMLMGTY